MADVSPAVVPMTVPDMRSQLSAIARLRGQIFRNSLRTMRGRLEMVSLIFMGIWVAVLGLGGSFGLAVGAWLLVVHGHTEWLPALFWPVFLFWILFPLLATAFTETFDSANLLRYPLRYSSFFLVNLIYGSLDPSTVVGLLWLLGIFIGAALAAPAYLVWTALAIGVFGATNILLVRALFSWIERWLAQRRSREIMGILFIVTVIGFQMIGPAVRHIRRTHFAVPAYLTQVVAIQRFLPAGLAADAIVRGLGSDWARAAGALALLACYGAGFLLLLHFRLRAQYAGENLGEAAPRERISVGRVETRSGWALPGLSGAVAAMMEKEARFLSRSGPMLFTLVMPVVVLFLLHVNANPARASAAATMERLAFPIGAAYVLLLLTNLVYNTFGADGAGIQFYFLAPVRLRDVVLAKNLVHAGVLAAEMCLIWIATKLLYSAPAPAIVVTTLVGVMFVAPLNFAVGNLLSINMPKKYDFSTFGRQRAAGTTVLASFGVQIVAIGIAVIVVLIANHLGSLWYAAALFAFLAVLSFAAYAMVLVGIDALAMRKREALISVLAKTG